MASTAAVQDGWMARAALRSAAWAEKWFPDAYVFAVLGVVIVALAAMGFGSTPQATASAFGDGFWSLIPFTMQMAFVVIGGYAVATAPVVARFIDFLARVPRTGRGAVVYVGLVSMLASLLSWGFSLVFGGLLVRALARRTELRMDYRAAGASAYLGLGAVWAMGLSSSAAQLQANPASMPPGLVEITGVLPFTETIFLWQSIALTSVLILVSLLIAWLTAPAAGSARTAEAFPGAAQAEPEPLQRRTRPGEWLEYSPLLTVLLSLLAFGWIPGRQQKLPQFSNTGRICDLEKSGSVGPWRVKWIQPCKPAGQWCVTLGHVPNQCGKAFYEPPLHCRRIPDKMPDTERRKGFPFVPVHKAGFLRRTFVTKNLLPYPVEFSVT